MLKKSLSQINENNTEIAIYVCVKQLSGYGQTKQNKTKYKDK